MEREGRHKYEEPVEDHSADKYVIVHNCKYKCNNNKELGGVHYFSELKEPVTEKMIRKVLG